MKKQYKNIAAYSSLAGLAWIGFAGAVTLLQKKLIFKPEHENVEPTKKSEQVRMRSVVIRGHENTRLSGWLITPRTLETLPAVIYFGGRSEDVSWIREHAETMFPRMIVLAVNYRGYGNSAGVPSELNIIKDATLIFDWLAAKAGVDQGRIALVGRSLGSGVALQVAAQRSASTIVLITPYDSIAAIARKKFPIIPMFLLKHRFESTKYAHLVTCPTLVLRAEQDLVVPAEHTDRLVACFSQPPQEVTIPRSDHSTIPFLPETRATIKDFVLKNI
jgi:dipeptidyl aminopeptidase/acylaminoacyl peptidase